MSALKISSQCKVRPLVAGLAAFSLVLSMAHAEPLNPDEASLLILNAGRRAFNEQQYPVATERFREFLKVAPNHKDASLARYGLGLALLESGDLKGAVESFTPAAAADFPERPLANYYLGVTHRRVGTESLAQIVAKPNEADALRNVANASFGEALKAFQGAADLLAVRLKKPPGEAPAELTIDAEWLIRARCDQAEMLLRLNKAKEASDLMAGLLAEPGYAKSVTRPFAVYHSGHASFLLKDYLAAGRALSGLAPFTQEFGVHARYLLARTHHLGGELAEAAAQYKAVVVGYEEQKKAAQEALKNPATLKPEQKLALEGLVNQLPPEYLARTEFYSGVLAFDQGRQAEAVTLLTAFVQKYSKSVLVTEAQFRIGAALVQLRKFPEATAALDPLKEHPLLGDQALTWLARARVGAADPLKPAEFDPALTAALDMLRRAAQRVQALLPTDPEAKNRRPGILLELADTAVLAKLFPEAITNYDLVINEKLDRAEEAMQRQVTARHLAAQYPEAEALALKFEATYPASTLLPLVLFRSAESAYLRALKIPDPAGQKVALAEAVVRYKRVVRKYPEFAQINLARHGLATAHYRLGNFPEAALTFATIADADRINDLVAVPYLLADCLIRGLASETDDAIQAARFIQQAEQAAKLLEIFCSTQDKSPQAADALLKLGYCWQRVGMLMASPVERTKMLTSARDAYDRAIKLTDKEPTRSVATFELAKCQALIGDPPAIAAAVAALTQFQNGPLAATPNAPLALLRLSVLMRAQSKAVEALAVMVNCRAQHDAKLLADPARASWVPMIQYEHAVALKESGKVPEARALFEALAKQFPGKPEALNAEWRISQCKREEAIAGLAVARLAAAKPDAKPEEWAAANKVIETQTDALRDAAEAYLVQAEALRPTASGSDAHLRMLYEAAWSYRLLVEIEAETARQLALRPPVVVPVTPPAGGAPVVVVPPVPAPPQKTAGPSVARPASEQRAVEIYQKIIATAPTSAVATQARCELAEIQSARGEDAMATDLLTEALEKTPAAEIPARIRLGLAAANLARKNPLQARANLQPLLATPDSPEGMEARAILGEVYIQEKNWAKAIEQLLPFLNDEKLRNLVGVSDRALLRLGHAYAETAQWDVSRQALEALIQRYPQSLWVDEARYAIGWAWMNLKNYDNAVTAFVEVPKRTKAEVAAKAQFQIGLARREQKRFDEALAAFLVVPYTYRYPEWAAAARCEAARVQIELKKPTAAEALYEQVLVDSPKSPWAEVAKKGLGGMK